MRPAGMGSDAGQGAGQETHGKDAGSRADWQAGTPGHRWFPFTEEGRTGTLTTCGLSWACARA